MYVHMENMYKFDIYIYAYIYIYVCVCDMIYIFSISHITVFTTCNGIIVTSHLSVFSRQPIFQEKPLASDVSKVPFTIFCAMSVLPYKP